MWKKSYIPHYLIGRFMYGYRYIIYNRTLTHSTKRSTKKCTCLREFPVSRNAYNLNVNSTWALWSAKPANQYRSVAEMFNNRQSIQCTCIKYKNYVDDLGMILLSTPNEYNRIRTWCFDDKYVCLVYVRVTIVRPQWVDSVCVSHFDVIVACAN